MAGIFERCIFNYKLNDKEVWQIAKYAETA